MKNIVAITCLKSSYKFFFFIYIYFSKHSWISSRKLFKFQKKKKEKEKRETNWWHQQRWEENRSRREWAWEQTLIWWWNTRNQCRETKRRQTTAKLCSASQYWEPMDPLAVSHRTQSLLDLCTSSSSSPNVLLLCSSTTWVPLGWFSQAVWVGGSERELKGRGKRVCRGTGL